MEFRPENTMQEIQERTWRDRLLHSGTVIALAGGLALSPSTSEPLPHFPGEIVTYEEEKVAETPPPLAENAPSPGWAECEFKGGYGSNNHCRSFYPVASYFFKLNVTDLNKECAYKGEITWGDGQATTYEVNAAEYEQNNPAVPHLIKIGAHKYDSPGRYSINTRHTDIKNACTQIPGRSLFDLYEQPTHANCENKFDADKGRTYMYAMLPKGQLQRKNGQPVGRYDYDFTNSSANVYVDEANVEWHLVSPDESIYHQPKNWKDDPSNDRDQVPYKKFTTGSDSTGGSFEAVLLPDKAKVDHPGSQTYNEAELVYDTNSWLTRGHGMPTYNYSHSHGKSDPRSLGHAVQDVLFHIADQKRGTHKDVDDRYVASTRWIDPTKTDWKTYRHRMNEARVLIDQGFRYQEIDGESMLTRGNRSRSRIDPEQAWMIKEMSDCAR